MNYINYFIKCIIRNFAILCMKPKNLAIFLFILLILFFLFNNESQAVFTGDNQYTDKNNTIILAYNPLGNDLITRLNTNTSNQKENLLNYLKNSTYGYYLYYGDYNGESMLNGSTYQMGSLFIAFYDLSTPNTNFSTYDNYLGMTTTIIKNNSVKAIFEITNDTIFVDTSTDLNVLMPSCLYNYKLDNVSSFLTSDTGEVTTAIQDMNDNIMKEDTEKADTEINSSYEELTTSTSEQDENSTGLFSFIGGFFTIVENAINNDSVDEITFKLPFVDGGITFRSDVLYNIIKGTLIYTMLQSCYWYVCGMYIVMGTWRILCWFQQGEFTRCKNIPINNVMNHMLM